MCASVAIDMCGLHNPILCCLLLWHVTVSIYIYMYFFITNKAHTSTHTHTHRTTVTLWGTHHSVAQWDECHIVTHTKNMSETMTPQSEPYNFVLCYFISIFFCEEHQQKTASFGISGTAGCVAPSSFRNPHTWLRQETCRTVINADFKKVEKNYI